MNAISKTQNQEIVRDILWVWVQRVVVIGLFVYFTTMTLQTVASNRDGEAYLNIAKAIIAGDFKLAPPEDTQYFIGYPLFLSFFIRFLPVWMGAYLLNFLCLAGIIFLSYRLFPAPHVMRWFIFCVPSVVLFTSLNMSEALTVFLIFLSLYALKRERWVFCGLVLGAGLLTRPQTVIFLSFFVAYELFRNRNTKALMVTSAIQGIFLAGLFFFCAQAFGDPLWNFKLYESHESGFLKLPFVGILSLTGSSNIHFVNKIYVWSYILFCGAGLGMLLFRKNKEWIHRMMVGWSCLQFLFYMSLATRWGFMEIPRYMIPVLPAAMLGFEKIIPQNAKILSLIAVLSVCLAVYAEASGNR